MQRLVTLACFGVVVVSTAATAAVLNEDPGDQTYLTIAINEALETRRTDVEIPLRNPDTGSQGMLIIERTYYRDPTTPCRDYRRTIERAGAPPVEVQGTGCRIGKALWSLDEVNAPPAAEPAPPGRGEAPTRLPSGTTAPSAKPSGAGGSLAMPKTGAEAAAASGVADEAPTTIPFPTYTLPSRADL